MTAAWLLGSALAMLGWISRKGSMAHARILVVACLAPGVAAATTFTGLGPIPNFSAESSNGVGVSEDGQTVVGHARDDAAGSAVFRWTAGSGFQTLETADLFTASIVRGVSANGGTIVGSKAGPFGDYAVMWTTGAAIPLWTGVNFEIQNDMVSQEARAVSADGTIVGGWAWSALANPPYTNVESFRWTAANGPDNLGTLNGAPRAGSGARGMSADGSVLVGGSQSPRTANGSELEAFRWTEAGGMVALGDLPGGAFNSVALGVSPDGGTVVGWATAATGTQAFSWTAAGGLRGLGNVQGLVNCQAQDASVNGGIIVGVCDPFGETHAFIWTASGGMQKLFDHLVAQGASGLDGWTRLYDAAAISADGQWIVGSAPNAAGHPEAYRVHLTLSDTDGDGTLDVTDNCTGASNPTQRDSDGDGYGNLCDADLNNSGLVTAMDFNLLRSVLNRSAGFSATAAAADLNGSGLVTSADFNLLRARLNSAPGPSGLHPPN